MGIKYRYICAEYPKLTSLSTASLAYFYTFNDDKKTAYCLFAMSLILENVCLLKLTPHLSHD